MNQQLENVFVNQISLEIQIICVCHVSILNSNIKSSYETKKKNLIIFYIFHSIAITTPVCHPECGTNAHCRYGLVSNECVCNPNAVGNPYEFCGSQEKNTCANTACGVGAVCNQIGGRVECICPVGYTGNAYVECRDLDECLENPCGVNAVCINTAGSYDCKCKRGFFGNPFAMCSTIQNDCDDPLNCVCGKSVSCPSGYRCENSRCLNLCDGISCGPRAACSLGKCVCPLGYIGDATDLNKGCYLRGQCDIDQDCKNSEICFQFSRGLRNCVDACSKFSCGPNALCISNNHRSTCICSDGFTGNPNDFNIGCQSPSGNIRVSDACKSNGDCKQDQICMVNTNGIRDCVNPCLSIACGANEECRLDANSNPACHCKNSYVWNPSSSLCEKPSIPDCTSDIDCHQVASCQPDALGILKCTSICDRFQCPANSNCVAVDHRGLVH